MRICSVLSIGRSYRAMESTANPDSERAYHEHGHVGCGRLVTSRANSLCAPSFTAHHTDGVESYRMTRLMNPSKRFSFVRIRQKTDSADLGAERG